METPNLPAIRALRPAWNKGRIVGQERPLKPISRVSILRRTTTSRLEKPLLTARTHPSVFTRIRNR